MDRALEDERLLLYIGLDKDLLLALRAGDRGIGINAGDEGAERRPLANFLCFGTVDILICWSNWLLETSMVQDVTVRWKMPDANEQV